MSIQTFSGTHEWNPIVLIEFDDGNLWNADDIADDIDNGTCPRCTRPLPELPEYPAGSRVTQCRTIPICGRCGSDETYELLEQGYISYPGDWPLEPDDIDARRERFEAGNVVMGFVSGEQAVTPTGVTTVVNPRDTGGWAQYGEPV